MMRHLLIQVSMTDGDRETVRHVLRDFHVLGRESRDLRRSQIQRADKLAVGEQRDGDNTPDSIFFERDPGGHLAI